MKAAERKRLKNGSYSTLITVIVIAVLLIVNFIVAGLPSTWTKPDFSEQQTLALSQQTKTLVSGLSQDVTIYLVAQQGKEDNLIQELVEKYAALSSKIHVVQKDTALDPAFVSGYTTGGLADNSLIVESQKRNKVIAYDSIYRQTTSYNESYQQVVSTDFDGENQLTNAIDYVTSETLPVIYAVSGHSETAVPEELATQISGQNMEVKALNLIQTGEIPADCSALLFYAPQKDITEKEKELLTAYFEQGGALFIITTMEAGDTPNLDSFLKTYGLSVEGSIVCEGDTGHTVQNMPDLIWAQMGSHAISDPLVNGGLNVLVADAQTILFTQPDNTVTGTELLTTTPSGYVKNKTGKTLAKEEGDASGKQILGLALEKKAADGKETGRLVLYTTPMMFDNSVNTIAAGGNYDLMINSFGWMCQHESAISIHAKSMDGTPLQVSSTQANVWSTVLVAVIPLALIVVGVVVWIIRRRR